MWGDGSNAALLAYLAAGCQIIGFLIRDQLVLRLLLLAGSGFYIVYYLLAANEPLWDAIICSALMIVANGYTMMRIIADRRPTKFDDDDLVVYRALPLVAPGDFRRIMALSEKGGVEDDMVLTEEGIVPSYLYFLVSGQIVMEKRGTQRTLGTPIFIGEIAYLLNQPASAKITLCAGGRFARWKVTDLRELMSKHDSLRGALEMAFNRDLAAKVAAS